MRIIFKTDGQDVPEPRPPRRETSRSFKIALFVVVGVSLLAVLGSFVGDGGLMVIYQQSQAKKDLQARIAAEETRRRILMARVEALKNDPLELERMAREELGLVREREIIFDFREVGPK